MKKHLIISFLLVSFFYFFDTSKAQTVGLQSYESGSYNGYTLFAPFFSKSTFLIDNCGKQVNHWESEYTSIYSVLLENGHLLRTASKGVAANPNFVFGGGGEKIQEVDWDGNVLWEFEYSDSTHRIHHDFVRLANGNLLIPVWELKTKEEAIEAGRDSSLIPDDVLWGEFVIEVNPSNDEIVWEWHMWDPLIQDFDSTKSNYGVIADHPELFNINITGGPTANGGRNWMHINSIDYNPMMDQILLNTFFLSEFFIIDHSTSTAQAATHSGGNSNFGGDLLYRWGNPQNYHHGNADSRTVYGSHNAHWISEGADAGKIIFFNNGNGRSDGSYSSIDIIVPPVDDYSTGQYIYLDGIAFGPLTSSWSYTADPTSDFYSNFLSSAQVLNNENILVCSGANGRFFEINKNKEIVWEYINPVINGRTLAQGDTIPVVNNRNANIVFRCSRYGEDFAGFTNVDLSPGDPIELNFTQPYDCTIISGLQEIQLSNIHIFPNPANDFIQIEAADFVGKELSILDLMGRQIANYKIESASFQIDISKYSSGLYLLKLDEVYLHKILISN